VRLSVQKIFRGYIPGSPSQRGEEGRQKGGEIRMNGRKGMGRKDEEGGEEEREGG
jgi:hypothetical protein